MNPMVIALVALFSFVAGAVTMTTLWKLGTRTTAFMKGGLAGLLASMSPRERLVFAADLDGVFHAFGFCLIDTGGGPVIGDGVLREDLHGIPPGDDAPDA